VITIKQISGLKQFDSLTNDNLNSILGGNIIILDHLKNIHSGFKKPGYY